MQHIFLRGDSPRTAVRCQLLDACLRQLLQEQRHLGQHGLDGLGRFQSTMRASDEVGLAGQWASGRSMM